MAIAIVAILLGTMPSATALGDPASMPGARAGATEPAIVVLLHGLARSDRSMSRLESVLAERGYETRNLHYASRVSTPEQLVDWLHESLAADRASGRRIHFVTHSLGGIVVRAYLAEHPLDGLGRVVMLAPPNGGSEVVDQVGDTAWFRAAFGPTGASLGTGRDALPSRLPAADFPLGVIAGSESVNPLGSWMIPGPDDGAVAIDRTRVDGMSDFIVVEANHTFIMQDEDAIVQVLQFLESGHFAHPPGSP